MTRLGQRRPLVLASRSPRRRQLLQALGQPFEILELPETEEKPAPGTPPREFALKAAYRKLSAAWEHGAEGMVIAADTVVCLGSQILGKPRDLAEARRMLQALSGRTHTVITGLAVGECQRQVASLETVETRVRFKALNQEQIERYLQQGEPLDKAGAYAIQDDGGEFVERIDGCYYNVVGLPLDTLHRMLEELILLPESNDGERVAGSDRT